MLISSVSAQYCSARVSESFIYLLWQVQVERGMKVGERIVFHGEGDEAAGVEVIRINPLDPCKHLCIAVHEQSESDHFQ